MDRYIIETEATVLDIEGEKWLIVLNTFDYGRPEAKHLASDELWKLRARFPNFVTGMKRPDGTFGFACSDQLEAKIRARLLPNHAWKKIRLYPPSDAASKPEEIL